MRRLALGVVVLALAGCGPENDDGTRSLSGTGGVGGGGGAVVQPIADPAAEAQLCEIWPDCPPGVYADGGAGARVHYGCENTVVRSSTGVVLGVQGQRACSKCVAGPVIPAPGCWPEYVGRCKAPARPRAPSCAPGDPIIRPDGTPWMIDCTGYELAEVVCWDWQTPPQT